MPRDRSRSPRRKERRRSRSRERDRRPDEAEKRLDKFGRDVSSRPTDRYGSSRGFREEAGSSRRREESRDDRSYGRSNRDDDKRYNRNQGFGHHDSYSNYSTSDHDNRVDTGGSNYYDDPRQTSKEKFEDQDDEVDEETRKMQQLMGIGGFDTTKNKKVANNVGGYAKVNKTQKYRQYMNRRGGFNRPLDYVQ